MKKYVVYYEGMIVTFDLDLINFGDQDPSKYVCEDFKEAEELKERLKKDLKVTFPKIDEDRYDIKIKKEDW